MLNNLLRPSRLIGLAVLGLALVGFTGCVSTDEHKKLQNAFDQARQQLAEAENDLANARKQIDALNARLAEQDKLLKLDKTGLQKQIDLLNAEIARLRAENAELLKAGQGSIPKVIGEELQKLADMYPDLLEYDPKLGMLRFKSDMTFDLGSTDVKPRAKEALRILAGILNRPEIASNEVRIVGHTDDVPIRQSAAMTMNPTNWFLSTNRAQSVRQVLQGFGVTDTRIQPAGWGETRPIAPNAPGHKGNEKNRRVEIYILPSEVPASAIPGGVERPIPSPRRPAPVTPRRPAPATTAPALPTTPAVPVPVPANG